MSQFQENFKTATIVVLVFIILYYGLPAFWEWFVMTFAYRGEVG